MHLEANPSDSIQSAISCASSDKTLLKPNGHQLDYEGDHDVTTFRHMYGFLRHCAPEPPKLTTTPQLRHFRLQKAPPHLTDLNREARAVPPWC